MVREETDKNYSELERVLMKGAYSQAAFGKGKERHTDGDGEPFEKQQICEIGKRLSKNPAAGPLFQAVKKIYESGNIDIQKGIHELYGAINYIAAAILILEEKSGIYIPKAEYRLEPNYESVAVQDVQ